MHMPTTRRARYIFYRQRAMRRAKRIEVKRGRPGGEGKRRAARELDVSSLQMQVEKLHGLKYVISPRPLFFWSFGSRVKPDYGLWGVVPLVLPPPYAKPPWYHFRFALVGYAFRRVHHYPRLRHLPVIPYRFPVSALGPLDFYPWATYPSGRHNPRAWKL